MQYCWIYSCCISFDSYIKPQPAASLCNAYQRCISFDSYIKPQLLRFWLFASRVVYLLIPTSNHNYAIVGEVFAQLYIFWFLHQTTTTRPSRWSLMCCISFDSYIKPQPYNMLFVKNLSCISFDSYIKPQRGSPSVSHPCRCISFDSYIKPQPGYLGDSCRRVVYLLIPTSNHNL